MEGMAPFLSCKDLEVLSKTLLDEREIVLCFGPIELALQGKTANNRGEKRYGKVTAHGPYLHEDL